jgi:hypothetical protein
LVRNRVIKLLVVHKSIVILWHNTLNLDALGVKGARTKLKLLNINGVAKLKTSNYKGPLLDPKIVSEWTAAHVASNDTKLSAAVVESLGNFLPADKYLRVNVKLDSGVFVGTCYIFITRLKGKNDRTLNVLFDFFRCNLLLK